MPYMRCSSAISLAFVLLFFSSFSYAAFKELIITGSSTWRPFSFINEKGEPDGIMVDFWTLYAKANQINISFHLLPWSDSLSYASKTPTALHGGLGYTSDRGAYLTFSGELPLNPYHVYLFVQKDLQFNDLNFLRYSIVGTVKESTKHAFMLSRIPERNIKQFPTFGALNAAAYRGEVNLFIDDLSSALYDMKRTQNVGLFTPRRKLYSFPLHFAVGKDFQYSIADIEQGLDNISKKDIQDIYTKWLPQNQIEKSLSWLKTKNKMSILLIFIFMAFLGLIIYRKRLNYRTKELKNAVKALNQSKEERKTAELIDHLTGSKTRQHFFDQLNEKRFSSTPYLIAVLDLDALQEINKQYGHDIGDIALKHLATQVKLNLPSSSTFARLGGGEFAISFSTNDIAQANRQLKRLQKVLSLNLLNLDQQIIPVKFQYGLSSAPYESDNPEGLIQLATERMRTQKNNKKTSIKHAENDLTSHTKR